MSAKKTGLPIVYREYHFPSQLPILSMQGRCVTQKLDFIHFHNCLEIALCERGAMTWNLENREMTLLPGELCLVPPYLTHACAFLPQREPDVLCRYLFFDPRQLLAPFYPGCLPQELLWYDYMDFDKKPVNGCTDEAALIRLLADELSAEPEGVGHSVRGLAEALLALLSRRFHGGAARSPGSTPAPLLIPAVSYLDAAYDREPDGAYLAQLCGLTERQFLKLFRQFFGRTPLGYLRTLRIHKACRLLTGTEDTVLSIALQTGFTSLSAFNRSFREIMGRSPQAFRRERREIIKRDPLYMPYRAERADSHSLPPAPPHRSSSLP